MRHKIREVRKTSRVNADDGYVVVPLKSHPSTSFLEYNEEIPACYKKEDRLSRDQKDKHTWPTLDAV